MNKTIHLAVVIVLLAGTATVTLSHYSEHRFQTMLFLIAGDDYSSSDACGFQGGETKITFHNQACSQHSAYGLRSYSFQSNINLKLTDGNKGGLLLYRRA